MLTFGMVRRPPVRREDTAASLPDFPGDCQGASRLCNSGGSAPRLSKRLTRRMSMALTMSVSSPRSTMPTTSAKGTRRTFNSVMLKSGLRKARSAPAPP